MDLKKFRRIEPVMRLSWSLYKLWVVKDWIGVWNYLLGNEMIGSVAQQKGTLIHDYIEEKGHKLILGIEKYIEPVQEVIQEEPVVLQRDGYVIVMRPDLFTTTGELFPVDWKSGKSTGYDKQIQLYMWGLTEAYGHEYDHGYLMELDSIFNDDKTITLSLRKVKCYEKSKHVAEWEDKFYEMHNDIQNHLPQLNKYLRFLT